MERKHNFPNYINGQYFRNHTKYFTITCLNILTEFITMHIMYGNLKG